MRRFIIFLILISVLLMAVPSVFARTDVYTGTFTTTSESHSFEIYMEAGWSVELTMECTPTNQIDPYIWVTDSGGNWLWDTDDTYTPCASFSSSRDTFTAPATGNYTIWAGQAASSAPGPYRLTIDGDFTDAISSPVDSDGDGVTDDLDQCEGHDDAIDVDTDGTPDGCDDLIDNDGDGVANDDDQCPGADDRADADSDRIPDCLDDFPNDFDNDGVDDKSDQCQGHDDAFDADYDGIPDGCDDLNDTDRDGVADDVDQCEGYNDHEDVDADNIPDGCDDLVDNDGDGVANDGDQCEGFDDSADVDGDGKPDDCDDVNNLDVDGDGIPNERDNCPRVANPTQVDDDGDGLGAPCDPQDSSDVDGDGVGNSRDNCPYAFNPDQENGWGSPMGDACDNDWYNMTGLGIAGFEQHSGIYNLHGNCIYMADGAPRCPVIASFDPTQLDPTVMPMDITTAEAGTWSVWVHYLHSNNGADVYQVNVYSTNPAQPDTLVDDRLEIHVTGGTWRWFQRGGLKQYGGI